MYNLLLDAAWIFLGWAGIDYLMEWRSRESRLRMSKQEMRDEYKETEGSPQIKATDSRAAAADAAAAAEGGCFPRVGGGHQPDALCRGAELRFRDDGRAEGAGQRAGTCWRRRFAKRRGGRACRSWRTRRWRARSTGRWSRARRFRMNSMRRWRDSGLALPARGGGAGATGARAGGGARRQARRSGGEMSAR